MTIRRLKTAIPKTVEQDETIPRRVTAMLREIEAGGEAVALDYARKLDGWSGDPLLPASEISRAEAALSEQAKQDIRFAHDRIRRFAEAQRATLVDMDLGYNSADSAPVPSPQMPANGLLYRLRSNQPTMPRGRN